jgi:FKBP-type peptidyl-prolyl cis-trans isomerase
MRMTTLLPLLVLLASCAPDKPAAPKAETDEQKTLYAIGQALSRNLVPFNLSPEDLALVQEGLGDGVLGRPAQADLETWGPKIQEFATTRATATAQKEKQASQSFLEKAAAEPGARKTDSGLVYKETAAGTGEPPSATAKVKVHYHGTLADGTVFDSSVKRGEPMTFPLNGVIKCWTEGLQLMKPGGKAKLTCPSDLAYGDRGSPPSIKPGAALVFEVELIEIVP